MYMSRNLSTIWILSVPAVGAGEIVGVVANEVPDFGLSW